MSETTLTTEDLIDAMSAILDPVPVDMAMSTLIAGIMSATGRCTDPHRAMLGAIAALVDMLRFAECPEEQVRVHDLATWINTTWQE